MPREERLKAAREYLLIRGRLHRDDTFVPRRCGSTTTVKRWPDRPNTGPVDVVAETHDGEGRVLRSESASVHAEAVCAPDTATWRVRVYVPLDPEASKLLLRRGDRVLWSIEIPEPPAVSVGISSTPRRGKADKRQVGGFPGGEPAVLKLKLSPPVDPAGAYLKVVYRWREKGFHTVYLGPPSERISIAADRLPGGPRCAFFVAYSDGVRSAIARTKDIQIPVIGPVLTLVSPVERSVVSEGMPIELECHVQDPEFPASPERAEERLVWIVDGTRVASGSLASIDPLPSGTHRIEAVYLGEGKGEVRVARELKVRRSKGPVADRWPAHDPFSD